MPFAKETVHVILKLFPREVYVLVRLTCLARTLHSATWHQLLFPRKKRSGDDGKTVVITSHRVRTEVKIFHCISCVCVCVWKS